MRLLVFIVILGLCSRSFAQAVPSPDVEAVPPGEDVIVPLRKGQPAPFTGQLFDPLTALRWANWLQQYKYRLKWDVKKAEDLASVELEYQRELLVIEKERSREVEEDLVLRLARSEQARIAAEHEARNPPWYTTWEFGAAVGAVLSAVVFGVSTAAVRASSAQ